mgnify:CR=1 FL=1
MTVPSPDPFQQFKNVLRAASLKEQPDTDAILVPLVEVKVRHAEPDVVA